MATLTEVLASVMDLINTWKARDAQLSAWTGGTATGGPNGDGKYPLPGPTGGSVLVDCPAKLASMVNGPAATAVAAQTGATTAKTDAEAASTAAVAARDVAEVHKTDALSAKSLALTYRDDAAASAAAAATAQAASEGWLNSHLAASNPHSQYALASALAALDARVTALETP